MQYKLELEINENGKLMQSQKKKQLKNTQNQLI